MLFFTKGKTNWEYILIVAILALIVGGGILGCLRNFQREISSLSKFPEIKKPEKIEKRELNEMVQENIYETINKILPKECDKEGAQYYIQDLNGDGKEEVIIIAFGLGRFPGKEEKCYTAEGVGVPCPEVNWGCIEIASLEKEKNYKKIGELKTEDIFRSAEMIPKISRLEDIDADNQKEIFLSGRGVGHYDFFEGILDVDFENQKLNWLKLKDEKGNIHNAIFWRGREALGGSDWDVEDIDEDGKKEIVEKEDWIVFKKPEDFNIAKIKQLEDGNWEKCEVKAYEWDGLFFSYNEELSKIILELKCK
jgi:hypothetical protein